MTLEQQVTSLELSKKLKELGVKQESIFQWIPYPDGSTKYGEWYLQLVPTRDGKGLYNMTGLSAYTVAELGEMLPSMVGHHIHQESIDVDHEYHIGYVTFGVIENKQLQKGFIDKSEADARAKMLIYLLENNLIELDAKN